MAWILFKILVAADRWGIKDDLNLSARFCIFSCASGSTFTVYAICDLQKPKFKFTENDLHPLSLDTCTCTNRQQRGTNVPHPLAFFFPFWVFPPLLFGLGDFFPSRLGSNAFVLVLFSGLTLLLLLLLRLLECDRLLLLSFLLRVGGGDLLLDGCHLGSFLSSWGDLLKLLLVHKKI